MSSHFQLKEQFIWSSYVSGNLFTVMTSLHVEGVLLILLFLCDLQFAFYCLIQRKRESAFKIHISLCMASVG